MLCLDTYALIEVHDGGAAYAGILQQDIVVTEITLAEFYGLIYRRLGEKTANYWLIKFAPYTVAVDRKILLKAAKYKEDHRKERFSFFDCVGYMYALENNMQFVTGDKEFKEKDGVLFIE